MWYFLIKDAVSVKIKKNLFLSENVLRSKTNILTYTVKFSFINSRTQWPCIYIQHASIPEHIREVIRRKDCGLNIRSLQKLIFSFRTGYGIKLTSRKQFIFARTMMVIRKIFVRKPMHPTKHYKFINI